MSVSVTERQRGEKEGKVGGGGGGGGGGVTSNLTFVCAVSGEWFSLWCG